MRDSEEEPRSSSESSAPRFAGTDENVADYKHYGSLRRTLIKKQDFTL